MLMILAVEIISIIFMLTLMFIGIWGFIVVIQIHNQLKYRNYILEKLSQNVYMITSKLHQEDGNIKFTDENDAAQDELDQIASNISKFKK
jgi:hypothetical protein